ncbi:hypothetical protein BO86DRAFT_392481 [Aspergillus japonicus CBS 114.51]|uniref:CWF21 domain-containing protein n=2 Tax=Aspergillus TaxID=5052 RepID=A0A2V5HE08_ASPV1|nr:hypothetical protein BO86DRAFT_392481 [Aspergillus japonicus CBS 114.51]PYI22585.1 hypothetical protein BO99DRAFT_399729 [Aspergillus violaceofuscus CBS 115571]RAH77554.1 hypothetical protein BO86DRAFT_392481 [Aspergillus japonicus CBS 114.51]
MSSNVGLSTPRGSGTSGYVQRNAAFIKPRATGYGQPYPPVSGANSASERGGGPAGGFKQRVPDRQILEHDRRRAVEVQVMELREELEDANERLEDAAAGREKGGKGAGVKKQKEDEDAEGKEEEEEGEAAEAQGKRERERVLSEEEIDERCQQLRERLLKELEEEEEAAERRRVASRKERDGGRGASGYVSGGGRSGRWGRERDMPPPSKKQFKSYQVHELAEAKIEESERLRRALGIREDRETGEISGGRRRD